MEYRMTDTEQLVRRLETLLSSLSAEKEEPKEDIEIVAEEVAAEIDRLRTQVERTLRPLQSSDEEANRIKGQDFAQRAQRNMQTHGAMHIGTEYARAMESKETDYATELLYWAMVYTPKRLLRDHEFIRKLNAQHKRTLGVDEIEKSIECLQTGLEQLAAYRQEISGDAEGEDDRDER
jgi:hypothetical protein